MAKFFTLFLLIQAGLFVVELLGPVQARIVMPFTESIAHLSAWLVQSFDPKVVAYDNVLRSADGSFAVAIQPGCNGVEAMIVLAAAILAFPAPWRNKLFGFAIGFVAIQGLNLIRIISLFYLGQWNMEVFQWTHLYLWQALIMLDALVVFLLWLRTLPPREPNIGADANVGA